MSDTLHASLHVHLWEPDSIGLFRNSRWRRSVSEGNANAERKPFTTSEIQQKLQRGCGCKYSEMAVVEGDRKHFFGAAMCRLNVT